MKKAPHRTIKPARSTNRIYIDQSGKVEGSGNTVIAYANGKKSALLIKDITFTDVVIDTEYLGKSSLIKGYLLELFRANGKNIPPAQILFHKIGKKCEAHWHSYYVFTGKRKPEKVATLALIREVLKKIL